MNGSLSIRPGDIFAKVSSERLLRQLMDPVIWSTTHGVVERLRLYEEGLEGSYRLEELLVTLKSTLTKKETDDWFMQIAWFRLRMLDKLDLWEEYLEEWSRLRSLPGPVMTYTNPDAGAGPIDSNLLPRPEAADELIARRSFLVDADEKNWYLHFLYGSHHRKKVIERKLRRTKRGRGRKSDHHPQQDALSEQEKRRRLRELERRLLELLSNPANAGTPG